METSTKISFTGKETNQELRQALSDCSAVMWEQYSKLVSKDTYLIGVFTLAKELHNEILSEMAKREIGVPNT